MLTGFRAGADPDIGVSADDFTGTRHAWRLLAGTASIGRVFPNSPRIDPSFTPAQVVANLDRAATQVLAAGMWPYLSLKPDPASVIAGKMDAHLTAVGRWAATLGVPVYFSPWHEPENDPMGAAATDYLGRAKNFVIINTRAYHVIKAAAGDAIQMGPCHLIYKWDRGTPETADGAVAAAWRVPDTARDFIAADAYTSNWSWTSVGAGLAVKRDFQRWMTTLAVPAAQLVLTERGISRTRTTTGADDQAAVLTADYKYLQGIGAHALLVWNGGGAVDNSVYLLGAPARSVFLLAATDAATTVVPPVPPIPDDRYQIGYDAGMAAGLAEGTATGRQNTLHALTGWITQQTGPAV